MKSKKILALALSVIMLLSLMATFTVSAADLGQTTGTCGDNLTWSYDDGTGALTISGTGPMYDYEAKTAPWIHLNKYIYSVEVKEGVTSIGNWAFAYFYYSRAVSFPEASLTSIGSSVFYQSPKLEEVLVPTTVTKLGSAAFAYCPKLMSVAIPETIKSIGKYTFFNCKSLATVYYQGDTSAWNAITKDAADVSVLSKATILYDTVAGINWAFTEDSTASNATLVISGYGRMKNYEYKTAPWYIYSNVDRSWKVKKVIVEEGVTGIGNNAFSYYFNLTEVVLPESLVYIGAGAFYNCQTLATINIPDAVTRISSGAFYNCKKLTTITLPNGIDTIYANTFLSCSALTDINYNGTKIQWGRIQVLQNNKPITDYGVNCLVKSIEWSIDDQGVLRIGGGVAMDDYELKVDPMAPWAAVKTQVKKVIIEEGTPNIGKNAFYGCTNLTEIEIPSSVTSIGYGAFWTCTKLTSIVLPENLEYLGGAAFYACSGLKEITVPNTLKEVLGNTFYANTKLTTVYYVGTEAEYASMKVAANKNDRFIAANVIYLDEHPNAKPEEPEVPVVTFEDWEVVDGILYINANTPDFTTGAQPWADQAADITGVVFAKGVTEIGEYTFEGLAIESIVLPEGMTTVPAYAFANCTALKEVTVPASVTVVEDNAAAGCAALATVYYDGTAEEFAAITIGATGNDALAAADLVFTGKPGGGIELPDFDF